MDPLHGLPFFVGAILQLIQRPMAMTVCDSLSLVMVRRPIRSQGLKGTFGNGDRCAQLATIVSHSIWSDCTIAISLNMHHEMHTSGPNSRHRRLTFELFCQASTFRFEQLSPSAVQPEPYRFKYLWAHDQTAYDDNDEGRRQRQPAEYSSKMGAYLIY